MVGIMRTGRPPWCSGAPLWSEFARCHPRKHVNYTPVIWRGVSEVATIARDSSQSLRLPAGSSHATSELQDVTGRARGVTRNSKIFHATDSTRRRVVCARPKGTMLLHAIGR